MDNKDNNVENNTNPNMEDNGVKIVNNEIELKIDEPKKEEIEVPVEEVKVEVHQEVVQIERLRDAHPQDVEVMRRPFNGFI